MWYKNSNWEIINNRTLSKKKSSKKKTPIKWRKVYYIGKTKSTWTRIVFYQWKIISHDKSTWICVCSILDRDLILNPKQIKIQINIPFSVLRDDDTLDYFNN